MSENSDCHGFPVTDFHVSDAMAPLRAVAKKRDWGKE
jgi:hypothetical protein